jgi:hypothetical protein
MSCTLLPLKHSFVKHLHFWGLKHKSPEVQRSLVCPEVGLFYPFEIDWSNVFIFNFGFYFCTAKKN